MSPSRGARSSSPRASSHKAEAVASPKGGSSRATHTTAAAARAARRSDRLRWRLQLESRVLERVPAPSEVIEFCAFEELSKLYAIEAPFVARTRAQLMFNVYDGKKLRGETLLDGGDGDDDGDDDDDDGDESDENADDDDGYYADCAGEQSAADRAAGDEQEGGADLDCDTSGNSRQVVEQVPVPTNAFNNYDDSDNYDCDNGAHSKRHAGDKLATTSGPFGWCKRLLWPSAAAQKGSKQSRARSGRGRAASGARLRQQPKRKQLRLDDDTFESSTTRGRLSSAPLACCVSASDTTQELNKCGFGALAADSISQRSTSVSSIEQAFGAALEHARSTTEPTARGRGGLFGQRQLSDELAGVASALMTPAQPRNSMDDETDPTDEPEESALRAEAWHLVRTGLEAGRVRAGVDASAEMAASAAANASTLSESASALALDVAAAAALNASGRISVCLFDKRQLNRHSKSRMEPLAWPRAQLSCDEPTNGPEWASACVSLGSLHRRWCAQLMRQQQQTGRSAAGANKRSSSQQKRAMPPAPVDEARLARLAAIVARVLRETREQTRRRQQVTQKRLVRSRAAPHNQQLGGDASSRVAGGEQVQQLIELAKTSLNQLIDAQLLLRNWLTSMASGADHHQGAAQAPDGSTCALGLSRASQLLAQASKGAEYENLLKNNFNLLKIWQNLEETPSGLVCFVCEPLKANLADLFWFNRHRSEWANSNEIGYYASSTTAASSGRNQHGASFRHQQTLLVGSSGATDTCSASAECLIASPLISLDSIQLKRGLMQILDALGYLHTVCKLIHRNVTPRNILIAANNNWKLAGLEFAIRFESTSINESSSLIANERPAPIQLCYTNALGRYHAQATGIRSAGATDSGAMSRGSGAAAAKSNASSTPLRRQRTLHQTKCQEFSRRPKCLFLQPEIDYLAPEIWRTSKCSHKSDLFSFGLIVLQAYDLCRHRSPLECNGEPQLYESELHKLEEWRRKGKLFRQVPFEMRPIVFEMLETEPNLRPSANYATQLLKRPIEMCKTNEDSLKHLRSSLAFLDKSDPISAASAGLFGGADFGAGSGSGAPCAAAMQAAGPSSARLGAMRGSIGNINLLASPTGAPASSAPASTAAAAVAAAQQQQQQQQQQATASSRHAPARSYFRKVTSASAQMAPKKRQQTSSLKMLNLMLRSIDSLAMVNYTTGSYGRTAAAQQQQTTLRNNSNAFGPTSTLAVPMDPSSPMSQQSSRRGSGASSTNYLVGGASIPFEALKFQCEKTFANLKLALTSTRPSGAIDEPTGVSDSRSLLLLVALHRRLLEQVSAMRSEVPPVCRMIAPAMSASNALFGNDKASQNHRALADFEERLHAFIGRHSIGRLASSLTDPMLKLDEFLLVFELVVELIAFVGQKCRQSFALRGKQLLNELMPVTGCPSSSSSDDDDDDYLANLDDNINNLPAPAQQPHQSGAVALSASSSRLVETEAAAYSSVAQARASQVDPFGGALSGASARLSSHRYSDLPDLASTSTSAAAAAKSRPAAAKALHNQLQLQHQTQNKTRPQLPTSINITAPSPMGSVRDLSGRLSADSACLEAQISAGAVNSGSQVGRTGGSSCINQRALELQEQQQQQISELMASQLSLSSGGSGSIQQQAASRQMHDATKFCDGDDNNQSAIRCDQESVKSRSQLIDELLKTINDDSFNEFIDFNNKCSAQQQTDNQQQDRRPRSAIDSTNTTATTLTAPSASSQQRHKNTGQQNKSGGQQQHRHSATPSTFDNVIRRMSTNFVQNFNKMSGSTTTNISQQQQQQYQYQSDQYQANEQPLRREKSSTPTGSSYNTSHLMSNASNSLYVDNQIPVRRHSDNTINVPRIQVALSSPQNSSSRTNLNPRASVSASKLANKWKLTAKTNQREATDKLSPNLGGALGYMRRHSSGNTTGSGGGGSGSRSGGGGGSAHGSTHDTSNGHSLLNAASPFKTKSSSNLGLDFLLSNRSMKRRYSAASMLGHQTQRKAENLIDAGMKSVQNMFN